MRAILLGLALGGLSPPAFALTQDELVALCQDHDPITQIKGCTALIRSANDDPKLLSWAYNNRGNGNFDKDLIDRAIIDFTQSITLNPNNGQAYINRGSAYKAMGLRPQAIDDYRAALKIDPELRDAKEALIRLGVTP